MFSKMKLDSTGATARLTNSWLFQSFVIVSFGLLAHGLVIFTDYRVWDSWINDFFLRSPAHWHHLAQLFSDSGKPGELVYLMPYRTADPLVFYIKLFSLIIWIVTFLVVNKVMPVVFGLSVWMSLAVSLVAVSMPIFEFLGESCMLSYISAPLVFWTAWYVYTKSTGQSVQFMLAFRALALVLFWFAFQFNSLLFLQVGIVSFFILKSYFQSSKCSISALFWQVVIHIDALVIPFAFWLHKRMFNPLSGYPASVEYNVVRVDLLSYASNSLTVIQSIFNRLLSVFDNVGVIVASLSVFCVLSVVFARFGIHRSRLILDRRVVLQCLGVGFLVLVFCVFPYIAVGKPYTAFSYDSRNGVLLILPLAMILVCLVSLIQMMLSSKETRMLKMSVLLVCSFGIVESNRNYLRLSGYGAKHESIALKVRKVVAEAPSTSVVHLREYFQMPKTIFWIPAVAWTYMLTDAQELPKVLVVDTRNFLADREENQGGGMRKRIFPFLQFSANDIEHFCWLSSMNDSLTQIPRDGETLNLAVLQGELGNNAEDLGLTYLINKWKGSKKEMQEFMSRITSVFSIDQYGNARQIQLDSESL